MRLAVIGTGYVGLVTGACFAEMGNHVTCVDIDEAKLEKLRQGIIPIYEPKLDEVVKRNHENGLLEFTSNLPEAIDNSSIIMIAVGTPPGEDGSADLSHVLGVAREIGQSIKDYTVVVTKSTVPVGTSNKVRDAILDELKKRGEDIEFDVASNPEFLKEGAAVDDFMRPDRVVIGTDSDRARDKLAELYEPFSRTQNKLISMGIRESEMTKYAANAMLATKISFMNEIANLCEYYDADVERVREGIGSDKRIGFSFIYPGVGYGGSCFPKDVKALVQMAKEVGFDAKVLNAVEDRNDSQKRYLVDRIIERFGEDLSGLTFGMWGLAFKPGTDDMREATSLVMIHELTKRGATIKAYDPVAIESASRLLQAPLKAKNLIMAEHQYDAAEDVDGLILVTEWNIFRQPDFDALKRVMKQPIIFDGRNQYDPTRSRNNGFEYFGVGR